MAQALHRTQDELVRRGLKFSQLRLLAALRDSGQIGTAAAQVGMTQPAASRLLAQLDTMAGTPIYTRHPRGVTLTEAGHILADQATATLKGLDSAYRKVGQIGSGVRGHVRVGSVTGPSLELLLPAMREARLAYPDISITVRVETSDRLAEALLADDLDFYIGRVPDSADARPFSLHKIGAEPISLIVRLHHPLSRAPAPTLQDCLGFDWVMQPPGGLLRRTAESYLLERGLPLPRRVIGTTSILFTLALLHDTNAIAPLARAVGDFFIQRAALGSRLDILPVAQDMAVADFGIVSRAGDPFSPAVATLRDLITAQAASSRPPAAS